MNKEISTGLCRSCKKQFVLDNEDVPLHYKQHVVCGGSNRPPLGKPFPKGYCAACKQTVIIIDGYLRQHKNKVGGVCPGSDKKPSDPLKEKILKQLELEEKFIPRLLELEKLPPGLDAAIKIARLFHECVEIEDSREFIRILSGPPWSLYSGYGQRRFFEV